MANSLRTGGWSLAKDEKTKIPQRPGLCYTRMAGHRGALALSISSVSSHHWHAGSMSQSVRYPTEYPTDHPLLGERSIGRLWPLVVELAILAFTAPLLYFPEFVQPQVAKLCRCDADWMVGVAVALLALLWPLRRWLMGQWAAPLPRSVPVALWFWFLVMLPVAVWAAPPLLREQYAWPRGLILIWNFSLFWSVLSHASRERLTLGWALTGWMAAVVGIALLAPFGMEPRTKLPVIGTIQGFFPRPLMGLFAGAESGFSTNQVAGTLLYVLPLMMALCVAGVRTRGWRWWLLLFATGWTGMTLVLSQSRGGLLGLLFAVVTLLLLTRRWGWYALGVLCLAVVILFFNMPPALLDVIADAPGIEVVGGVGTVSNFRQDVWNAAYLALQDFFFTGMGLGSFRALAPLLYPLPYRPPSFDLAHAHNFFLQSGLDFGVPGLVAILVVFVAAIVQVVRLAHAPRQQPIWAGLPFVTPRVLAIGWMGCLVGQTIYSLFDAVAMGSKPNFVWWLWLALIFAAGNLLLRGTAAPQSAANDGAPDVS